MCVRTLANLLGVEGLASHHRGVFVIHVRMLVTFEGASKTPRAFEKAFEVNEEPSPEGERLVWEHLSSEMDKEMALGEYYDALPDIGVLGQPVRQTFSLDEIASSAYFDRRNTRWVWFEIDKTLIQAKFLLAEARTYKAIEPPARQDPAENQLLYNLHCKKMGAFDSAVYRLAKTEDLFLRLVFENLGASLVPQNPNWERQLTWERIKEGLRKRTVPSTELSLWDRLTSRFKSVFGKNALNPHLEALSEADYQALVTVFRQFRGPAFVRDFVAYRDRLTHRITPSVDYLEFYTHLEDRNPRPLRDKTGTVVGKSYSIGARPTQPEYLFLQIYDAAVKTMQHYVTLLVGLKAMPRFSPEAVR